jgi:Zn-finger nucleic acid-binding protein
MAKLLACPVCKTPFLVGRTLSTVFHGCTGCGGVWLDEKASARVFESFCEDSVRWAEGTARRSKRPPSPHGRLACPTCGDEMRPVQIKEAGVEVDVCESHGTWFDKSELAIVARALHAPDSVAEIARAAPSSFELNRETRREGEI